jgi:uncharacterized membrane protein YdjX (TVP38/TMEM64 family)
MRKDVKIKLGGFFSLLVIVSLFILLSYLVQTNFEFFERLIVGNLWGLVTYVFLNFIGIVVAPVTVIPLIVIITGFWGWFIAGVVTWIAWVSGAVAAFLIARIFGVPIVKKFISLDELYKFENRFSIIGSFWGVVFLRMVIPVEVLSYGLGLFSRIGFWRYTFASALGLFPVSLLFGYIGVVPFIYQIVLALFILICILLVMILREVI